MLLAQHSVPGDRRDNVPEPRQSAPGPHLHPIFELLGNSWQIVRLVQCRCGGGAACRPWGRRAHALRAVKQFLWLEAGSGKVTISRPAHAAQCPADSMRGITPAVSLLGRYSKGYIL